MPSGKNWVNFLYINLAFAIYMFYVFYYGQVAQIKAKWPLYRCNPMYMPLADNVEENFVYCVQSIQSNFMGHILQPVTFATGSVSNMLGEFTDEINNVRAMFYKIRTFFSNTTEEIFGAFLNLSVNIQKTNTEIKNLIVKTNNIVDGSLKAMNTNTTSSDGKSLGKCFHPNTSIKLKDGTIKVIKDVDLGDILQDGSIVETVMKIDNKREHVPLYEVTGAGVNGENIYVTGSHLVFDNTQNKFICVEKYNKAKIAENISTEWLCCLITTNHKIPIENEVFWDWEDHFIKNQK